MSKNTYVTVSELAGGKCLNERSYFQAGLDFFNPKKGLLADTIFSTVCAGGTHVITFTGLDPYTSFCAGVATTVGAHMGNVISADERYQNLSRSEETVNGEDREKLELEIQKLKDSVTKSKDSVNRGLIGLLGIIGWDVSHVDSISQSFSNGLVDAVFTVAPLVVAGIASYALNDHGNEKTMINKYGVKEK